VNTKPANVRNFKKANHVARVIRSKKKCANIQLINVLYFLMGRFAGKNMLKKRKKITPASSLLTSVQSYLKVNPVGRNTLYQKRIISAILLLRSVQSCLKANLVGRNILKKRWKLSANLVHTNAPD